LGDRAAGRPCGDAVSQPVARFNPEGTAAPAPRHGAARRPAAGLDFPHRPRPARARGRPPAHRQVVPERHRPAPPRGRAGGRHRPGCRCEKELIRGRLPGRRGDGAGGPVYQPGRPVPDRPVPRPVVAARGRSRAAAAGVPPRRHGRGPGPVPPGRRPGPGRGRDGPPGCGPSPPARAGVPTVRARGDAAAHAGGLVVLEQGGGLRRILERRPLGGQHPSDTGRIIARIEAAGRHWDAALTPSGWGGKRAARRLRQRGRRHRIGGSGACARAPIPRRAGPDYGHAQAT
jgi:hypothetical protein